MIRGKQYEVIEHSWKPMLLITLHNNCHWLHVHITIMQSTDDNRKAEVLIYVLI